MTLVRLDCPVRNYQWGKQGGSSAVAALWSANVGTAADADKRYAELWMGTHATAPSTVHGQETLLSEWLVERGLDGSLPFLFKVLSIDKALSIQAHPDLNLAKELHARDPKNYRDANHKPEMTIALTKFEGMCGFRPAAELAAFVNNDTGCRELNALLGTNGVAAAKNHRICDAFSALMNASETAVKEQAESLADRLAAAETLELVQQTIAVLCEQFPGDIGVFCPYFLNIVELQAGECMFLAAGEPHAYIAGDCVECMACSDNVVRAGLTPKFKDVPTLLDMLTYRSCDARTIVSEGNKDGNVTMYNAPVEEFDVVKVELEDDANEALLHYDGHSMMLVLSGEVRIEVEGAETIFAKEGHVYFATADTAMVLKGSNAMIFVARGPTFQSGAKNV